MCGRLYIRIEFNTLRRIVVCGTRSCLMPSLFAPPSPFPGSKTIMSVTNAKAWSLHPKTQALMAVAGKQIYVTDLLKQTTSTHQ